MVINPSGGGAGRVATVLASELSSKYHMVLLHTRNYKELYPSSPAVDKIYLPIGNGKPENFTWFHYNYLKLLKKQQNVYATISFLSAMNIWNVGSKAGDKVICSERSNPTKGSDSERFENIQSVYEQADHVIFQSEVIRDLFSSNVKSHCSILPNPVGVYSLRKTETEHRIVSFSRLAEQKNHAMLICGFRRFYELHPEYSLSIYGDGPLRDDLAKLICKYSLQEAVHLNHSSAQIHRDIADAEFFVLTSDYEGLSNSLLEAMMMGFPCISTDCEGSTDVIEDGVNGLLIHRGNEDELLAAMLKLAEDTSYREELGRRARQTAERFQRKRVAEQWAEVIERV